MRHPNAARQIEVGTKFSDDGTKLNLNKIQDAAS
jgi:hypothetical protein